MILALSCRNHPHLSKLPLNHKSKSEPFSASFACICTKYKQVAWFMSKHASFIIRNTRKQPVNHRTRESFSHGVTQYIREELFASLCRISGSAHRQLNIIKENIYIWSAYSTYKGPARLVLPLNVYVRNTVLCLCHD